MSSSKDVFEPHAFAAWSFAAGAFRGIGIIEGNYFYRPITGPSKQTYTLVGEPKGLPVLTGSDEENNVLVGP